MLLKFWISVMKLRKKDQLEVFGPQIELNVSNPTDMGEPPVEATGVAPTMVVKVEEEFSVEFVEKKEGDQAKGTGSELVLDFVENELRDQAVKAGGEFAHEIKAERTEAEPVLENVKDRFDTESDLMEVE